MSRDELVAALKAKETAACVELRALMEQLAALPGADIMALEGDMINLSVAVEAMAKRAEFFKHSARIAGQFPEDPAEPVEVGHARPELKVV